MIGVGFKKKRKITLESSFEDNELETAIMLGESLASHSKKTVTVFLYKKGNTKVKVLKNIRMVRTGFLGLRKKVATV